MNCPRCERNTLEEIDRDGLTIDRCPSCRGVWLDRGELEKLIARAAEDAGVAPREFARRDEPRRDEPRRDEPRRDWDDDDDRRRYGEPRRKKRWFESLGDVFD
jgi:uncharacterized protein